MSIVPYILDLDRELLLAINHLHTPWLDSTMICFSRVATWVPLYAAVAGALFFKGSYGLRSVAVRGRMPLWITAVTAIAAAVLCYLLCDHGASLVKGLVCRPRPSHEPALEGMVRLIHGAGGQYGFFSAHAANTFGFATFIYLIIRRKGWLAFSLIWATAVSYSRIYLARHYPGDIIVGAAFGVAMAFIVYKVFLLTIRHLKNKRTR